jgi:ribosomal-protein-alanine N-acetyltransferase
MTTEIETPRLRLRKLHPGDASFLLRLMNDPAFIRYIGDRGIRDASQAATYMLSGPMQSYSEFGFGLLAVESKSERVPLGLCGLVKRDYLPDPDLGFAFLPAHRSHGFCTEAALAVLQDATLVQGFKRISAIVQPDNVASLTVLKKIGFGFDRAFRQAIGEKELLIMAYYAQGNSAEPS